MVLKLPFKESEALLVPIFASRLLQSLGAVTEKDQLVPIVGGDLGTTGAPCVA